MAEHREASAAFVWRLLLVAWLGGLITTQVVTLPVMIQVGIAPLLVENLRAQLASVLTLSTAGCALSLSALLWMRERTSLLSDRRGRWLLLTVLVSALAYLAQAWLPTYDPRPAMLVLTLLGLLLLSLPVPRRRQP